MTKQKQSSVLVTLLPDSNLYEIATDDYEPVYLTIKELEDLKLEVDREIKELNS